MNRIEELESLIKRYSESYYSGESEVTDEYFDELVDELRDLDPNSEVLKKTGWGFEPAPSNKVKHLYNLHVGSLRKVKSIDSIPDTLTTKNCRVSAKLDGLSVVSYYSGGKRVLSVTRGNGTEGKDVTRKINIISPETEDLHNSFTGAVRGEVLIDNYTWSNIKEKYKDNPSSNQRNVASGIMNRNDFKEGHDPDLELLRYVVYKVIADEGIYYSSDCSFWEIAPSQVSREFDIVPETIFTDKDSWKDCYFESLFKVFCKQFPCDGLVITNRKVTQKDTSEIVFEEVAYKFQAESKIVTVTDIDWNVTRTGRLAPRIWFDPVELSGAVVRKCTGYNAQFIKDSGIGKGAVIEVCRSNEVIPTVMKVVKKVDVELPTVCPSCNSDLVFKGVDLVCESESDSQLVYRYISTVGSVDGAGWSLYNKIIETFNVENLSDLVSLILLSRSASKIHNSICENISGSVTQKRAETVVRKLGEEVDPVRFIAGCNITGISWTTAENLLKEYPEFIYDITGRNVNWGRISSIKGFGYSTVVSLQKFEDRIRSLAEVTKFLSIVKEVTDIQFKVAITGSLSVKRSEFENRLAKKGIFTSNNFKEIKFLITNNPDSGSSKMKKAKESGVEVISETEFSERYLE